MIYDEYLAEETALNCVEQDLDNYIVEAYLERVMNELRLMKQNIRRLGVL